MTSPRRRTVRRRLGALGLAAGLVAPAVAATRVPTLDDCDAWVARAPGDPEAYYCYTRSVRAHGRAEEAARRLESLLAANPDRHRARLNLGAILHMAGDPRAEATYRAAAQGMAESGDAYGEVMARRELAGWLASRGRVDEGDEQLALAMRAAEDSRDPQLVARVLEGQAGFAMRRSEHDRALSLYRRAEAIAFPDGPAVLQDWILSGSGSVWWYLGDYSRAIDYFRREAELARRTGDRWSESLALYNAALTASSLVYQGRIDRRELVDLLREALAAARQVGSATREADVRLLLGQRLCGAEGSSELRSALELSRRGRDPENVLQAQRLLAARLFKSGAEHHEEAFALVDEAIAGARALDIPFAVARGLVLEASLQWLDGRREEARATYEQAFAAIEEIRTRQSGTGARAQVFSTWAFPFYRLSGYLLEELDRSPTPDEDLDLSFRTIERMRARALLDRLDAAGAGVEDTAPPVAARADVQRALDEDQAMLAFQITDVRESTRTSCPGETPQTEGGSWVVVVTRDATRAYAIPDIGVLEQQTDVFLGLFRRRDGSEARAATGLYRELLADALRDLPPGIERFVIVPDRVLHRLPFEALREDDDAPPLGARFEVSYAPSATLWLRWKPASAASSRARPALLLVDADLEGLDPSVRGAAFRQGGGGPLPHARREAVALRKAMDGGVVRLGPQASESFLKHVDLSRFGLVHFGTHAVVDDRRPERTAVLLAPGSRDEDGLVRIREIVDLEADGQVVVLSACRSASGRLLTGEGVLGLAHAFFQAGARAVVGALWPLRDDDTAELMEAFARKIGRGRSVAAALAEAKRERIEAGAPAEAWAGIVVLGDGDLVPVPGGRHRLTGPASWLLLAALVIAGVVVHFLTSSRREGVRKRTD